MFWKGCLETVFSCLVKSICLVENTCLVEDEWIPSFFSSSPNFIPLFESLLKESKRNFPVMSQQIEDTYNSKRRINAEEREMEVVTQALARHFKKEYESN